MIGGAGKAFQTSAQELDLVADGNDDRHPRGRGGPVEDCRLAVGRDVVVGPPGTIHVFADHLPALFGEAGPGRIGATLEEDIGYVVHLAEQRQDAQKQIVPGGSGNRAERTDGAEEMPPQQREPARVIVREQRVGRPAGLEIRTNPIAAFEYIFVRIVKICVGRRSARDGEEGMRRQLVARLDDRNELAASLQGHRAQRLQACVASAVVRIRLPGEGFESRRVRGVVERSPQDYQIDERLPAQRAALRLLDGETRAPGCVRREPGRVGGPLGARRRAVVHDARAAPDIGEDLGRARSELRKQCVSGSRGETHSPRLLAPQRCRASEKCGRTGAAKEAPGRP